MNLMPVEMFDHIVINTSGKSWAVFELQEPAGMTSYRFHSDAATINYAAQIATWIRGLPLEARLLSVASPISPEHMARAVSSAPHLIAQVNRRRHDALTLEAERAAKHAEERPAHRRSHFLCVTLDSADNFRSSAIEAITQVSQLIGRRRAPSSAARRKELLATAELTQASLGPLVRPASAHQVRWLMQRAVCRGLVDQPEPPKPPRPGRSRNDSTQSDRSSGRPRPPTSYPSKPLLDATLIEGGERRAGGLPKHRQLLRVESTSGESFQTSLVLASMPPEWSFPENGYWLAAADEFDFPVDVTVRIYSPPQHETKKQFRRRHKELASQPDQYAGTNTGVPDAVLELIDRSNAAQSKLEGSRLNRIHRTLTCLTVSADSADELKRRVATVRAEMAANGFEFHTPTGDQRDLFFLGLPGTAVRPGGVVADYDQDLTAEAIASGLPGFTPELGDDRGAYLGHRIDTGPPLPVLLSPSVTTSASTMGFGASGGGKSFTAKTIARQELIGGAQVVAIDRTNRGEYVQFASGLPEFLSSEVVDLSGEANISLCPMSTFPPEDRVEITTSFLCLLAGVGARTMESARIAQAVEFVADHEARTGRSCATGDVLDVLRVWGGGGGSDLRAEDRLVKDAGTGSDGESLSRDLYYRIAPLARTRFAQLAFQPGTGVSVQGADLIVLHARGLVLPSKDELRSGDDLDASKAASIAMVYLLMALADTIGNTPNRLSSIILDEAWAFLDSSFGIDLANRVLRDGRKDFKKLQLWSQHPSDAPTDLLNMASNVFLSRQVEGAGATALKMVGAESSPELISMVEQLGIGEMIMRDEYGRLGVIKVAPPADPRVAESFDTRPQSGDNAPPVPRAAVESNGWIDAGLDPIPSLPVSPIGELPPGNEADTVDAASDTIRLSRGAAAALIESVPELAGEPLDHGQYRNTDRAEEPNGSIADQHFGLELEPDDSDPGELEPNELEPSELESSELESGGSETDDADGPDEDHDSEVSDDLFERLGQPKRRQSRRRLDVGTFSVPKE